MNPQTQNQHEKSKPLHAKNKDRAEAPRNPARFNEEKVKPEQKKAY